MQKESSLIQPSGSAYKKWNEKRRSSHLSMLMGRMQRKWESRIRNRNFWARCSCNRVIRHSCRGSGRAGSGTGTSGLAAPATELSFIHAEEVGE